MEDRVKQKTDRLATMCGGGMGGGKAYRESFDRYVGDPVGPGPHFWADESSHIRDAFLYGNSAMQTSVVVEDPLAKFKDHELIMALLKRGYAAMKMPDGGVPEVLK